MVAVRSLVAARRGRGASASGVRRSGELLRALVTRDVRLQYRHSILGVAWSQIAPLCMVLVLSVVFRAVVDLEIPNYPVFVFVGLLAWLWFQNAIGTATSSVVDNPDLVRHPGFPGTILPPVAIASQLVTYVLSLPALFLFVGIGTGRVPATAATLPVILGVQFVVMLGPAYVLAAFNVSYRDVAHLVGVVLLLLFYATPVFYDAGSAPDRVRLVFDLNPIAQLIDEYRAVLLYGRWPGLAPLAVLALGGVLGIALGRHVFRSRSRLFVQEL